MLDGATGAMKLRLPIAGRGVTAAVAVGDIDGGDRLEIVAFGIDGVLRAFDSTCR